jgi:hypothetical protein
MANRTISIETYSYIEFSDGEPQIGSGVFIEDSEGLGEHAEPFRELLQSYIEGYLIGDKINDNDRDRILDMLLGMKVIIKEATKQVRKYEDY